VAIDPEVSNYQTLLAWSLVGQHRFAEAEEGMRRALELEPGHVYALPNLGHLLLARGAASDAVPIYREVYSRGKLGRATGSDADRGLNLALALNAAGRAIEAEQVLAEALTMVRRAAGSEGPDPLLLARLEAARGHRAESERFLLGALAGDTCDPTDLMNVAQTYALLGQKGKAIEYLRRAFDARYEDPYFPLINPPFHSLLDDPDFRALFPDGDPA
jgi:tetratricopeptide (TPR) repeat protein